MFFWECTRVILHRSSTNWKLRGISHLKTGFWSIEDSRPGRRKKGHRSSVSNGGWLAPCCRRCHGRIGKCSRRRNRRATRSCMVCEHHWLMKLMGLVECRRLISMVTQSSRVVVLLWFIDWSTGPRRFTFLHRPSRKKMVAYDQGDVVRRFLGF